MRPMPKTLLTATTASRRGVFFAMLPLHALAFVGAAALAARFEFPWPLLIALACPLLHFVMRRD